MNSWLNSWRTSAWAGCIPNNLYYSTQRTAIEQLIGRGAQFVIASLESDPDLIMGWVCYELTPDGYTIIHYLYCKELYIPYGIGQELIQRTDGTKPGFFTHRYRQVSEACELDKGWKHAPEIARRK